MSRTIGSKARRRLAAALVLAAGAWAFAHHAYGIYRPRVQFMLAELRAAPSTALAYLRLFDYWYPYLDRLAMNPETGVRDFEQAARRMGRQDLMDFALLHWHRGDFAVAVGALEEHHRRHAPTEESLFWLGMSYLRLAEADNCLSPLTGPHAAERDHSGMCALPIRRHHRDPDPARAAAAAFERLLDDFDPESRLYRWLLNFCYMTMDGFPDEVTERYLIRSRFVDLFYGAAGDELARRFGEARHKVGHTELWLQRDGGFERRVDLFRDAMPQTTMGLGFGDLDNDGAVDYYLGTGNPEGWFILPNVMYLGEIRDGRPTGHAQNVSMLEDLGTVQKGHAIVFFDFDDDGDQDVYQSLGGMWPGDKWPNQMLVNESRLTASWIKVRLRGTASNHYGVGARVRVVARDGAGRPVVRYHLMDNGTGFGSAPYVAHVGLGDAVAVDRVEVTWPGRSRPVVSEARIGAWNHLTEREPDS